MVGDLNEFVRYSREKKFFAKIFTIIKSVIREKNFSSVSSIHSGENLNQFQWTLFRWIHLFIMERSHIYTCVIHIHIAYGLNTLATNRSTQFSSYNRENTANRSSPINYGDLDSFILVIWLVESNYVAIGDLRNSAVSYKRVITSFVPVISSNCIVSLQRFQLLITKPWIYLCNSIFAVKRQKWTLPVPFAPLVKRSCVPRLCLFNFPYNISIRIHNLLIQGRLILLEFVSGVIDEICQNVGRKSTRTRAFGRTIGTRDSFDGDDCSRRRPTWTKIADRSRRCLPAREKHAALQQTFVVNGVALALSAKS